MSDLFVSPQTDTGHKSSVLQRQPMFIFPAASYQINVFHVIRTDSVIGNLF